MIVKRKLLAPGLPVGVIARPRLDELFSSLLELHGTVAVFAAGGSGKTVQSQMFAARFGWPLCWLTVDEADRSGSRLLFYLAEAVRPLLPKAPDVVSQAVEAGLSSAEIAAMLADSLPDQSFLIVLDDCETIAGHDDAASVLGVFLEYLPVKARALLLSRDELEKPVARMLLEGRIGRITDADLALDETEARTMLTKSGQFDRDAGELLAATHGWIAAFAFDVRPSDMHSGHDALLSYMRTEILGRLPEDEQRFLLFTSLLNAVTPRFAVGLCGPEAYNLWRRIRYRYLPATMTADRTLVYHSRFRAFLREQLEIEYPDELPLLRRRQAGLLVELSLYEEAVSIYLDLGDLDEATLVAERAVPQLNARADWSLMLRWFEQLGPERVDSHPLLQGALIRCLYGTRQIVELNEMIQALHKDGLLSKVAKADPAVVSYLGWALQWRPAEALELLDTYQGDYRAEGVRFELRAVSGRDAVAVPAGKNWSDMERLVSWGLLVQGRMPELIQMLPDENEWPPVGFYRTPHPILGLVWQGEIARARDLLDQVPAAVREGAHTDLWYFHEAWVLWAEGDVPGALEAARAAVAHSSRTGFGWEPCFDAVVGHFMVLLGQADDARSVLSESLRRSTASRNRAYAEWGLTFEGLACLLDDQPADAVRRLRRAYDGMRRARRMLMMPFAGLYLAEAEWRLGNEQRSLDLAREAYDVSAQMGSLFVLQRGLENVPNLLERQIASDDEDHRWRRLQLLRKSPAAVAREPVPTHISVASGGHTLEIQTFGDTADLVVDGHPACVKRLKTIEMAAFLALHPAGVERKRLQARLFPETDQRHGGNYYRQIVHKLRLSTGISLDRSPSGMVTWPSGWFVDSVDQRFERLTREAGHLSGHERLARLKIALEIPTGAYLQDSDLEWVEERRFELDVLRSEATGEAAQLALTLGRMEEARDFAERAVHDDSYSETAYRTLMSVEAAVGTPGAVMNVYRRLTDALAELNVSPDARTVALLQRLRAEP